MRKSTAFAGLFRQTEAERRLCLSLYVLLFAFSAFFAIATIITALARRTVAGTTAVSYNMYDHKHESDHYQRKQNNARYIHLIHNFTLCNAENHSDTAYKKRHYPRNSRPRKTGSIMLKYQAASIMLIRSLSTTSFHTCCMQRKITPTYTSRR